MVSTCRQLRLSTHAEGSSPADGGQHSSPCRKWLKIAAVVSRAIWVLPGICI
jgi:hypothetical protein